MLSTSLIKRQKFRSSAKKLGDTKGKSNKMPLSYMNALNNADTVYLVPLHVLLKTRRSLLSPTYSATSKRSLRASVLQPDSIVGLNLLSTGVSVSRNRLTLRVNMVSHRGIQLGAVR